MARFTQMLRVSIGAGVIVAVGALSAGAGFDPVDQDFSTGVAGYECATWDEVTGGLAPGCAMFEPVDDTTTLKCGGEGGFDGPGLTWPGPFTLSYWVKAADGTANKTHFNVMLQNTTTWDVAWFGLVNWEMPSDSIDGGEVTMDFPDFKTLSNPWGGQPPFSEAAVAKCAEKGWDEANVQILISVLFEVEHGTVWYDDIVMQEVPQSVEPMHLTVLGAKAPQTRSLTIAPNGRLISSIKQLNAASFLVELKEGIAVQRAVIRK